MTVAAVALPISAATAKPLGKRTLHRGMRGSDVRTLQRELTRAGIRTAVDGDFGPGTARSVRRFERRHHLTVDGVVGPAVIRELKAVISGHARRAAGHRRTPVRHRRLGARTLRQGMAGADVRALQHGLSRAGYPTTVDGQFGPGTKASVISFQRGNELTANGVFTAAQVPILEKAERAAVTAAPVGKATIGANGRAAAPAGAPEAVREVIAAANRIIDKPYIYGGGHGSFNDSGYDCSGAVSYALHGGNLLSVPEDSTQLESYGQSGPGRWITVYADSGHAFVVVAGIAFDTAHYGPTTPSGSGPRWLNASHATANLSDGGNYVVRHPAGL